MKLPYQEQRRSTFLSLCAAAQSKIIIGCIVVWTIFQLCLVWDGGVNKVFNWPDANANYHFAARLMSGQPLVVQLPFEGSSHTSYLATRSTRVVGSTLIPLGFLGLPFLYGLIGKLLLSNIVPYITLAFAGFGVYAWYRICIFLLPKKHAFLSAIVLLIHPGWFYYTNETLLPNILSVSLILGLFFFLFEHVRSKKAIYLYVSGLFFVLSVMVRPTELVWLIPLIALAAVRWRSQISWRSASPAIVLMIILCALWLLFQRSVLPDGILYGYLLPQLKSSNGFSYATQLLMPFGFHPLRIANTAWKYGLLIFWPFTALSALGAAMSWRKRDMPNARIFGIALAVTAGALLAQYGSGRLLNSLDPTKISIDNSYVRYFLPAYLSSIPFAVHALLKLTQRLSSRQQQVSVVIGISLLMFFSAGVSITEPVHGILKKNQVLRGYDRVSSYVISHTPADALVVTERGDKYIWPHRLVMVLPKEAGGYQALRYFAVDVRLPVYVVSLRLTEAGRHTLDLALEPYDLIVGEELFTQDDIGVYTIKIR